jgi:hypothetical protein
MCIGHVPGVVRVPTRHTHTIRPLVSAVLRTSPWARLGPDLYTTVIRHEAPGAVSIWRRAFVPGPAGEVTETTLMDKGAARVSIEKVARRAAINRALSIPLMESPR